MIPEHRCPERRLCLVPMIQDGVHLLVPRETFGQPCGHEVAGLVVSCGKRPAWRMANLTIDGCDNGNCAK